MTFLILMPFIKSIAFKYCACIVILILSLGVIMPIYSCYTEKKLVYIIITALFSHQPSSYSEYIKLNIYSSYNIKLVSNAKFFFYAFLESVKSTTSLFNSL